MNATTLLHTIDNHNKKAEYIKNISEGQTHNF